MSANSLFRIEIENKLRLAFQNSQKLGVKLKSVFEDFDFDGSGSVSFEEFKQVLTKFHIALTDDVN